MRRRLKAQCPGSLRFRKETRERVWKKGKAGMRKEERTCVDIGGAQDTRGGGGEKGDQGAEEEVMSEPKKEMRDVCIWVVYVEHVCPRRIRRR